MLAPKKPMAIATARKNAAARSANSGTLKPRLAPNPIVVNESPRTTAAPQNGPKTYEAARNPAIAPRRQGRGNTGAPIRESGTSWFNRSSIR
jgi:hypothetical protein